MIDKMDSLNKCFFSCGCNLRYNKTPLQCNKLGLIVVVHAKQRIK